MFSFIWPIGLVVLSNTVYQICSKSVPGKVDPFAALTITYFVGTVISFLLFFLLGKGGNILNEYKNMNWAPYALGVVIVGLEVGFIYAYKAGWKVSTASVVQSVILAVALIIVGYLLYKEKITVNKIIGMLICLTGLYFINK